MKKLITFTGTEYTIADSYNEYVNNHLSTNCTVHDLGKGTGNFTIYGLSIGDLNKPTLYFQGQIHGGHEWDTAHWTNEYMDILANPNNYNSINSIKKLLTKFSVYCIPCVNPYGYENDSYNNGNGVNLNRNFPRGWDETQNGGNEPFDQPEAEIVKTVVETYKPITFIDMHTWGGYEGSQMGIDWHYDHYALQKSINTNYSLTVGRKEYMETEERYFLDFRQVGTKGRSSDWAPILTSSLGVNTVANYYEPGSQETVQERSRLGLNYLHSHFLYMYEWLENRRLRHHKIV